MKNTKAEKAIKAAARVLAAVLSVMFIFGATACDIKEPTVQRLSPSGVDETDFAEDEEGTKKETAATTTAERDNEEFVYTYVTAPAVTTAPPAVTLPTGVSQPPPEDLPTDGDVVTCYGWNPEFSEFMNDYYLVDNPPSDVEFNWVIYSFSDYQHKLAVALTSGDDVDMFLAGSNYLPKFVETPYTLPITALGITENELGNQYEYTKAAAKDSIGTIKASAYYVTPEVIAYRRSIAMDVLGVSEPADVQPFLKDFTAFDATAEKMKAGGYRMVSSYADLFYSYINTSGEPIVAVGSDKITIPEAWMDWVDDTKYYSDKGYNNTDKGYDNIAGGLWTNTWTEDISGNEVFCYQGPPWLIDYSIAPNAYDTAGDWAVVPGPVNTYWDGTYLLAGANTDNADIVADIIRYFTTDTNTMENFARGTGTVVNNSVVNISLSRDTAYASEFLGGQNPFGTYNKVAMGISPETTYAQNSKYGDLCEQFQAAFIYYFIGSVDMGVALNDFYQAATTKYPELTY
jgi:hypothetical protein